MENTNAVISGAVFLTYGISAVICFGLFIAPLIYFARKRNKTIKPFLLGALAFFISQIVLRIPLLQLVLPKQGWFVRLAASIPAYALFLGFTAAIFEETARYIFFRAALKKNRRYEDGIAFGFGHGGIEAVLLAGVACISNISMLMMINNGTFFDAMEPLGGGYAQIVYSQLTSITPGLALTVGIERIIAVAMHVGLTILVLQAFNKNRIRYYWAAVAAHTFIDFAAVVLQMGGISVAVLETVMAFLSFCLVLYALRARRDFMQEEKPLLPEAGEGTWENGEILVEDEKVPEDDGKAPPDGEE